MTLRGFSWVLPEELAGMPMPMQSEADAVEKRPLTVPLPRDWPADVLRQAGLHYLHLPIADFSPPTPDGVDRFVAFCDSSIRAGRPVVVHCIAGRGRTGTMVACYLVHRGMGAPRAIRFVREARPGSIETPEQERAVHDYAARRRRQR